VLLLVGGVACGRDVEPLSTPDASSIVDERVPIPTPDPNYVDLVTPEEILQPGEEKMYCLHIQNDVADLAVDYLRALQGPGGHHLALFITTDPKPAGTLEDCTSPAANAKLQWFVLTFNALPAGHAIHIPLGMHYVLQFHYINSSDNPILVRDVARLERVDMAKVTTWVSTLISTDIDLALPPGPTKISWDCKVDQDRDLLVLCGHMHDMGQRFSVDIGPSADALTNIYTVDQWQAQFRDNPPSNSYYDHPIHLAAGSVIRTTCEWQNTRDTTLMFPDEMCTTFAYTAGTQQSFQCSPVN
jgi:hypothetical protein